MTQVFDEAGNVTPVTVIGVEPNVVVARRTKEKCGYDAVVLGSGDMKPHRVTKPYAGQFAEGITPKKILREFRDLDTDAAIGDELGLEFFDGIRFVDVTAISKGKGFQGVMKRWGFHGGRASHGSKFHREAGSTGQSTTPGHSFKNVKMPARMGGDRVSVQNLRIVKIDRELKVVLVCGAVPGRRNCTVIIKSAVKRG
jgi:large subunit ribosomal protein L3